MGYKIDFMVQGGKLIDDNWHTAIYSQDIAVSGGSVSDWVNISQDGQTVSFTTDQFEDFIREALKSSLFYELRQEMKNET